ncbi:MAG TPA: hypothetical protein V6D22_22200 [Candidatus Obscuribacterales bacterium]
MAVNQPLPHFRMSQEEKRASKAIISGMGTELLGGGAGIVLSILGLVGIIPMTLAAVALIVLGAALFMESTSVSANLRVIEQGIAEVPPPERAIRSGLGLTAVGALAVAVLGILTLLGIAPAVLVGAGVIAVGACGVLRSIEEQHVAQFEAFEAAEQSLAESSVVAPKAVATPAGITVLAGLATIVLGILALVGINPLTLNLAGLLVISSARFLSSAVLEGGMAKVLARRQSTTYR